MKVTKGEYSAGLVQREFWNDFKELNANFSDVHAGIVAYLQLNHAEELIAISKEPDPNLYRSLLTEALVTLIDRGALVQVSGELTDLAVAELEKLRRETGIGLETLPAPPAKAPSVDEILEAEVREDYVKMSSRQMMEKRRTDRAYNAMYDRIAETLGSQVTTAYNRDGIGS